MTDLINQPMDPRDAARIRVEPGATEAEAAVESQAALLLAARVGVLGLKPEDLQEEARESGFALPDLKPLQRTRRLRVEEATQRLGVSTKELSEESEPDLSDEIANATAELYTNPSTETAAALFEASMYSEHALVRVAAAAGARETTRLRKAIRRTLEEGYRSEDPLVAGVAQEAMLKIDRHDPYVRAKMGERTKMRRRASKSHTAVVTHGTAPSGSDWYKPGGDFYDALLAQRPDLDVHPRSFSWSGDYSTTAWREGAEDLRDWLANEGLVVPDFFAHSHGATVANRATKLGVKFDRLVLMGWPAREQWFPDFANVGRIIDVRVRLDLVILVDGGGQRFRTNQFPVEEHRNGWFNHFSTHESNYWTSHGLWAVP